ncbi:geranylgeranylglycerol-phosphate geranylgeranyltransferase [Mesonia aestuariivivens]|uniref:Geranylgeranylglycerol-phosphate geranylgeranyltransferase n=1 Tax=Mesonia aestuariivivens TaxID=2796128 RepID=A0ABS6VYS1_9FLAO|nr:geranylgeranylglycerol-phosphate geranylgeranyltransferase [Mesonia aestuariivivens]MBW2960649.1 geranylgeranylglycerol-phosphate geranylgeranyltransferase [Mesonia aestuariivivens]
MKYLQLVKLPNLVLIIITQVLIKYFLLEPFGIAITLNNFGFSLLVIATICLAAAGNIINAIFNAESDLINQPHKVLIGRKISEKAAYNLFFVLNILGVVIGFYLSNMIQKPSFTAIFIFTSALLYLYAQSLKKYLILGNVLISFLVAMSIVILGIIDLYPAITPQNKMSQQTIFSILIDYSIFAFLINWLREMVKDQQDINGDHKAGINTLPIAIGKDRTNKVIFLIAILPLVAILYYLYEYLYHNNYSLVYALVFIIAPLLYVMFKLLAANTKKDYQHLGFVIKLIMIFGIISIGLYQFILL